MTLPVNLILVALLLGGGFAAGLRWHQADSSQSQVQHLQQQLQQLSETADALRQSAVQSALNYDAAVRRLDEVARAREEDREHIRQWAADQQQALQALARAQPELGKRAGAGVLQHWNRSNAGPDAADSTPADAARQPGAAVPGATGGAQRRMDRVDRQPRPGNGPVSRLPQSNGAAAGCGPAMAGHRLAVVLRSGARSRRDGGALPA